MRDNFIDPYFESLMGSGYVEPTQQQSLMGQPTPQVTPQATQQLQQQNNPQVTQASQQSMAQGGPPVHEERGFWGKAIDRKYPTAARTRRAREAWETDVYHVNKYLDQHGPNFGPEMAEQMYRSNSPTLMKKAMAFGDNKGTDTRTSQMKNVEALGHAPGTQPYYDRLNKAMKKSGVSITNKIEAAKQPMKLSDAKLIEVPDGKGGFKDAPLSSSRAGLPDGARFKAKIAPGDAGKYMMLKTAQAELPALKDLLMPGGTVDRETLRGTTIENIHPWVGAAARYAGLSSPQSQQMTTILERGMQGITRTETGAAMPTEEIQNTKARFMPSSSDSDESIQRKMLAYEYFINNAVDLMNPTGLRSQDLTPEMATSMMNKAVDKAFAVSDKDMGDKKVKPTYDDPAKEAAWIQYQKDNPE